MILTFPSTAPVGWFRMLLWLPPVSLGDISMLYLSYSHPEFPSTIFQKGVGSIQYGFWRPKEDLRMWEGSHGLWGIWGLCPKLFRRLKVMTNTLNWGLKGEVLMMITSKVWKGCSQPLLLAHMMMPQNVFPNAYLLPPWNTFSLQQRDNLSFSLTPSYRSKRCFRNLQKAPLLGLQETPFWKLLSSS